MAVNIFHSGNLQSGIALAIQEQKVVACFISAAGDHESEVWENYWLQNNSQPRNIMSDDMPPLGIMLTERAVLLKIEFGSQEMDFLNAFCPIDKPPTLVVIQNGKVLEKLEEGVRKADFTKRLVAACWMGPEPPTEESVQIDTNNPADQAQPTSHPDEPPPEVSSLLTERAQRLEAERQKREAAEKADRIARAKAKRKEEESAAAASSDKGKQRATTEESEKQQAKDAWIYQQKVRKDEAKLERERILARIESDKQERKAQAQRLRDSQTLAGNGALSELKTPQPNEVRSTTKNNTAATSCALQVRLFDGSSIRGRFALDTDIATAVRTWVKEASPEGGADIPYTFRQILAPQPSRTIEVSEEHQTVQELGLVPSATLVLVPVAGYTNAYSNAGRGYISSALYGAYNTASGIVGSVLSYIPVVNGLYMGGTGDEQERSNVEGAQMAGGDSGTREVNIKTLTDRRAEAEAEKRQPTEFYNGNSSAFQGSNDDPNL